MSKGKCSDLSRPPNASTLVGSEGSGTSDLQRETLSLHHRRTRQPSLTAGPSAHAVQDCSIELSSSTP